ncbi:MAG TPA: carboxypeptidase-like regulatory domain-containing protein [Puia sp.]|nr:carboxypeptidase-like regulatory domain-containing protein [Puia sp.]
MLRFGSCVLFFLTCYAVAFSQSVLKGRVISDENKKPLASVSVYLNNTSIGTTTNDEGQFILRGIPQGKFSLVATSVGFETYTVLLDLRDLPKDFEIALKPKADELAGFSVLPTDPNGWEKYGKYFMTLMIGTTPNSNNTKLTNPEVVKFRLNEGNILTAFAKEPLKITNYTLGYEIEYKLEEFEVNLNTALVNYTGYAFYRDMGLKHPNRVRRYSEARFETYKGSLLHFMRSFYANDLEEQGFEMRSLAMISNPEKDRAKEMFRKFGNKPITSIADATIGYEVTTGGGMNHLRTTTHTVDSTGFFKQMLKQPDSLVSHQLIFSDSVGFAVDSIIAGFYFSDSMEVSYKWKLVPPRYKALSKKTKHETIPVSEFVFVNKTPVYIVRNGFYYKPYDLKITGYWAWIENVSTWLPFDYYPH